MRNLTWFSIIRNSKNRSKRENLNGPETKNLDGHEIIGDEYFLLVKAIDKTN